MLYSGPKSKILILNFGLERFWVWIPDFWILGDRRDVPLANSVASWRPVWVPFFGYIFSYPTWRVRSWISSSVIFFLCAASWPELYLGVLRVELDHFQACYNLSWITFGGATCWAGSLLGVLRLSWITFKRDEDCPTWGVRNSWWARDRWPGGYRPH